MIRSTSYHDHDHVNHHHYHCLINMLVVINVIDLLDIVITIICLIIIMCSRIHSYSHHVITISHDDDGYDDGYGYFWIRKIKQIMHDFDG